MPIKILICGAGAIGGFYGALFAKAGAEVSVICRSDYPIVKKQGYLIESRVLGNWKFTPTQVLKTANQYQGHADYLILCTKITPEVNRVQLIRDAVKKNTCIVFIQNGVEVEQELIDAFPNNQIISGLAFICCNRLEPGVIKHIAYGKLTLGSLTAGQFNDENNNNTQQLSDLINLAGIESITTDDIISSRWLKCLWNASFNPLSVLSDGLSTEDILTTQETLIRTIMQEICLIAEACGYPLPKDSIDINIENTYAMPAYKTSMLLDYESRKTMETEAILGNAIRAARRERIPCPTVETLYALMKLKTLHLEKLKTDL